MERNDKMTEPRIEKLFGCDSWRDKKFRRADVAERLLNTLVMISLIPLITSVLDEF